MGNITRRLKALEEHSRKQAAAEYVRAWERLTDQELALLIAPGHFERKPTSKEAAVEEAFLETMPEFLMAWAIGYSEDLNEEEVSRRLDNLQGPVIERRRSEVLAQLRTLERTT